MNNFIKGGWLKVSRNLTEMAEKKPMAFLLLYIIATRAHRGPGVSKSGLQPGEAWIGTSVVKAIMARKVYRNCLDYLEKGGHIKITEKSRRGTRVNLSESASYDINIVVSVVKGVQKRAHQGAHAGQKRGQPFKQGGIVSSNNSKSIIPEGMKKYKSEFKRMKPRRLPPNSSDN